MHAQVQLLCKLTRKRLCGLNGKHAGDDTSPGTHKVCVVTQCQLNCQSNNCLWYCSRIRACISFFLSHSFIRIRSFHYTHFIFVGNQIRKRSFKKQDYLWLKLYAHSFSFRSWPLIATSPETIVLSIGTIEAKLRKEDAVQKCPWTWKHLYVCSWLQQNKLCHFLFTTVNTMLNFTNENLQKLDSMEC